MAVVRPAHIRRAKPVVFVILSLPLAWLVWQWSAYFLGKPHDLGFNLQETSNRFSGIWTLRLLLLTLVLSPLAKLLGTPAPIAFRRMVGLFSFAMGVVHLMSYAVLDKLLDWPEIWSDLTKRWFIIAGMLALTLLLPLAITSTNRMIRRLGARRWQRLHRLIYPAALLAVVHFFLMVKGNQPEPWIYAAILVVLLGARLPWRRWRSQLAGSRRPKEG